MPEQQRKEIPSLEVVKKERERLLKQKQNIRTILNGAGVLIVVAAVAIIISTRFLPVIKVSGSSMEPTLQQDEILIFAKKVKSNPGIS